MMSLFLFVANFTDAPADPVHKPMIRDIERLWYFLKTMYRQIPSLLRTAPVTMQNSSEPPFSRYQRSLPNVACLRCSLRRSSGVSLRGGGGGRGPPGGAGRTGRLNVAAFALEGAMLLLLG